MAIPTESPEFATDATFAADGDTWSGDPTKADPGASRAAEGYEPDTLPAEWLNWQFNLVGRWLVWFRDLLGGAAGTSEWAYPGSKSRGRQVSLAQARANFGTDWTLIIGAGGVLYLQSINAVDNAKFLIPLEIPNGATLGQARLRVITGAIRGTAGNRFQVEVWKQTLTGAGAATQVGTTATDDGTASTQTIVLSSLAEVIANPTYAYWLYVEGPSGSVTAGSEQVLGCDISYTVPGPHPGA
jgi:hypothetical protein